MLRAVLYKEKELRIEEAPIPEVGDDEVLVKNKVSTTCGTDVKIYKRGYPLLTPPHPFGHEYSGVIAAVGKNVKKFKEGDRVAVHNTAPCGHCYFCKKGQFSMCEDMLFNRGSYAEYVKVPGRIVEQNMFKLDDTISHKTASLMEPFSCAVYGIDNCPIQQGDTVIVNGAGPIGLMFARLAVLRGGKVIVSDMKENRLETARKLARLEDSEFDRSRRCSCCASRRNRKRARGRCCYRSHRFDWRMGDQRTDGEKRWIHPSVWRYKGRKCTSCRCYTFTLFTGNDKGCVPYHSASCKQGKCSYRRWRIHRT